MRLDTVRGGRRCQTPAMVAIAGSGCHGRSWTTDCPTTTSFPPPTTVWLHPSACLFSVDWSERLPLTLLGRVSARLTDYFRLFLSSLMFNFSGSTLIEFYGSKYRNSAPLQGWECIDSSWLYFRPLRTSISSSFSWFWFPKFASSGAVGCNGFKMDRCFVILVR